MNTVHNVIYHSWFLVFLLLSLFVFTSCDPRDDGTDIIINEQEKSAYETEESAEKFFDIIESITKSAIGVSESNSGGRIVESDDPELACATVSFEGTRQSGRVEINFGDGCEGPGGKVRKGIIVVEFEGHWLVKDAKVFTVLQNFYVDGFKIEGTRILTNVSVDLESLVYAVEIIEGKITWPAEEGVEPKFLTRESERIHTLIFGNNLNDFELHVEGNASGKTRDGVMYSSEIMAPLVFKSSCRGNLIYMPTSGIKVISIPEKPEITVNYGDGACDHSFNIKIGDKNKDVTL